MSVTDEFSIELQERDGYWNTLGCQPTGGSWFIASSLMMTGDLLEKGCLEASWVMKMDPRFPRQCIEHYTPVVISRGGEPIWSGRIIAAPTNFGEDSFVTVQCQGWGQHLKDECTDRQWLISDLSRWVDMRATAHSTLQYDRHCAAGQVNVGDGEIYLAFPHGSTVGQYGMCGVVLDLGPNPENWLTTQATAQMTYTATTAAACANAINASIKMMAVTYDDIFQAAGTSTLVSQLVSDTAGPYAPFGSPSANPAPPWADGYRYVHIYIQANTGITMSGDLWVKISQVNVWPDENDQTGGTNILKASTIIKETLTKVCPLISSDQSRITATSTAVPNFPGGKGFKYGHELIEQANSFHGYVARLSPEPTPVFEFFPQPTDYSYAIGNGEYSFIEPAAQDGRNVYSKVISEFEDASGVYSYAASDSPFDTYSPVQHPNPTFDVNTNNWSTPSGTITRDTGVFDSTPASGRLTSGPGGSGGFYFSYPASQLTGLIPGRKYRFRFRWRRTAAISSGEFFINDSTGSRVTTTNISGGNILTTTINTWVTMEYDFIAPTTGALDYAGFGAGSAIAASTIFAYIDSVEILMQSSSVAARRMGRTALRPMGVRSTPAMALAMSALELENCKYPPFKGTIGVQGRIRTKGGNTIHVSKLPALVGDAILIEDLTDPNTGAMGRQGVIQQATYNAETDICELTIDDPTGFIEILRNRLVASAV